MIHTADMLAPHWWLCRKTGNKVHSSQNLKPFGCTALDGMADLLSTYVKLFRDNHSMTFYSLYLYSFTLFVVNNKGLFDPNNTFHQYNTRTNKNLHLPSIHLLKDAKGPYVNGIKVFNHLPHTIQTLEHSPVKFKNALKNVFHQHPFYSMKEYFEQGNPTWGSFGQRDLLF